MPRGEQQRGSVLADLVSPIMLSGCRVRITRVGAADGPVMNGIGMGAATIADIAHLMSSLYRLAMREHPPLVIVNPFADLELPTIEPRPVEFYERDEAQALYEAAGEWRTLVEL